MPGPELTFLCPTEEEEDDDNDEDEDLVNISFNISPSRALSSSSPSLAAIEGGSGKEGRTSGGDGVRVV